MCSLYNRSQQSVEERCYLVLIAAMDITTEVTKKSIKRYAENNHDIDCYCFLTGAHDR